MSIKSPKGIVELTRKSIKFHFAEIRLEDISFDPSKNYRWGNEAAMKNDVESNRENGDKDFALLKSNIRELGVQEPIFVTEIGKGKFEIIGGFTRFLAAKECGLKTIPAKVYENDFSTTEKRILAVAENNVGLKRKVNWAVEMEELGGIVEDLKAAKDSDPYGTVARKAGYAKSGMMKRIHEYNRLPATCKDWAKSGRLSESAARTFVPGKDEKTFSDADAKAILTKSVEIAKGGSLTSAVIASTMGTLAEKGEVELPENKKGEGPKGLTRPDAQTLRGFFAKLKNEDMIIATGIISGEVNINLKAGTYDAESATAFLRAFSLKAVVDSVPEDMKNFKFSVETDDTDADGKPVTKKLTGSKLLREFSDELCNSKKLKDEKGKTVATTTELCVFHLTAYVKDMTEEMKNAE